MTDKEFDAAMIKIRQGDKYGLQEIYEAYISLIYAIVKDVVQNKESAEDITSDFFIKLWDKADQYKIGGGHKAWMSTVARNMAIDYLRKYKKEEARELAEDAETEPERQGAGHIRQDSPVEREVLSDMSVKEALSSLGEKERQILNMKILGDMTFKEIAKSLHIPIGTVTWRYNSAVKKLRRYGYETGF